MFYSNGEEAPTNLDHGHDSFTLIAEQAGYVKETLDGPGFWTVSLTEDGQKALAAGDIKVKAVPPREGCDYQKTTLILGRTELVKINSIVPGPDSRQVVYTYRWRLTDLGASYGRMGKFTSSLTMISVSIFGNLPAATFMLSRFLRLKMISSPARVFLSKNILKDGKSCLTV